MRRTRFFHPGLLLIPWLALASPGRAVACPSLFEEYSPTYSPTIEAHVEHAGNFWNVYATVLIRGGERYDFPYVEYTRPLRGRTSKARAEQVLGVTLGEPIGSGGSRRVYLDPRDPNRVIKIYDPSIRNNPARLIAVQIQRELMLETFLRAKGIPVAPIDRSPQLLSRGIVVQTRIEGSPPPRPYRRGENAKLDELLDRIAALDEPLRRLVEERYGLRFSVRHPLHENRYSPVGVDVGDHLGNILITPDGEPHLIDW